MANNFGSATGETGRSSGGNAGDPLRKSDGDAQAIVDAVERLDQVEVLSFGNHATEAESTILASVIAVPNGKQLVSTKKFIDELRQQPERRSGVATITTQASFIAHVLRYKGDDSVIFADNGDAPSLTTIFDYNPAGGDHAKAAFGEHRARYAFPLSDEWTEWSAQDGKPMEPAAFALFLEDRLQDVLAVDLEEATDLRNFADLIGGSFASPTQLQTLARSIEINAAVSVKQALRLSSGEITVAFSEVHNDGEGLPIKVPNLFAIAIPIFVDGDKYRMVCRLRYRLVSNRITWWYTMVNPKRCFDDAVKGSVTKVNEETSVPVFYGAPEK